MHSLHLFLFYYFNSNLVLKEERWGLSECERKWKVCLVKHILVPTLFSHSNVANEVLLCIRCAAIRTLFSDANVANAVLLRIRCAADLRLDFLISDKRPPRDVIFYFSLDQIWVWWCNSCLDYSISNLSPVCSYALTLHSSYETSPDPELTPS